MFRFRTFLAALVGLAGCSMLHAQVVINEISYNPPESGTDSLEYIELWNAGDTPVNIGGWSFQAGIADTLPAVTLAPGDYFVTAVSAQAMNAVFGVAVHQWSSGGLSNNGELLWLVDENGGLIDSVRYDDSAPWPTEPDGMGPSLELTSAALDNNDGMSWKASEWLTGVTINGMDVKGTPGAENIPGGSQGPAAVIRVIDFAYQPNIVVVKVGDVVRWTSDSNTPHNVNGSKATFPANPEGFFSGQPAPGPWQFEFQFTVAGIYNFRCDPHAGAGMTGIVYVYDPNPETYNIFSLPVLRTVNSNGQALFDGVRSIVGGVVHGINFQPSGYSFYVINAENVGINVFSFDPGAYTVQEGDRVGVFGVIDQFNGQLEIIPDTIVPVASGQPLVAPLPVSALGESMEGSHVVVPEFTIDSIVATGTSGYNVFIQVPGGGPMVVRVDADSGFDLQSIEQATSVRGVCTQFDNSLPYTSGYQLLAFALGNSTAVRELPPGAITLYPNPTVDVVRLSGSLPMETVRVIGQDGRILLRQRFDQPEGTVNLHDLPAGIYRIMVTTAAGIWTTSVVKAD